MSRARARLPAALLVLALLLSAQAGLPLPSPYDPAPLLARADPAGSAPFTFAVFGDSYARASLVSLLDMVSARAPTFAVTTGDMVRRGSEEDEWRRLGARAGRFLRAIPTWPVVGNHELADDRVEGERRVREFYGLMRGSYTFVFRNCKFIVLDHQERPTSAAQVAFLRQALADRDRYAHVFVFRHTPFYTIGSKARTEVPNRDTELTRLLEKGRVTAVFCGHDHIYYRTRRGGVDYLTAGVAGAGVYELARLAEAQPQDAYMGLGKDGKQFLLHVPGRPERVVPRARSSPDKWLFAVFVHVQGDRVTAETVSVGGEVWERFPL